MTMFGTHTHTSFHRKLTRMSYQQNQVHKYDPNGHRGGACKRSNYKPSMKNYIRKKNVDKFLADGKLICIDSFVYPQPRYSTPRSKKESFSQREAETRIGEVEMNVGILIT